MDAVRGVGGQTGSPSKDVSLGREWQKALSGEFQGGGDPPGRRRDQLGKDDAVDRGLRKRVEGIVRLRDVAQPGRAPADAFSQSPFDRPPVAAWILSAKRDDLANPLGQSDPLSPQRRRDVAEVEVTVGVDQARQNGDVAQVFDPAAGRGGADAHDPPVDDGHRAVGQRRGRGGKEEAGGG